MLSALFLIKIKVNYRAGCVITDSWVLQWNEQKLIHEAYPEVDQRKC